jgi:PAS domain S-box-containing protein
MRTPDDYEREIAELKMALKEKVEQSRRANDFLKSISLYNRNLIDNDPDPFLVLDPEFRIQDANVSFEEFMGIPIPNLLFRSVLDLFLDPDSIQIFLKSVCNDIPKQNLESIMIIRDREIPVSIHASRVVMEETGRVSIFVSFHDISEIRELIYELGRSQKTQKAILDNMMTSIILLDRDLKISSFNKNAQITSIQFRKKELEIGDSILELIPRKVRRSFEGPLKACLNGDFSLLERRLWDSLGRRKYFLIHLSPVLGAAGAQEIDGIVLSGIDITERKYMEEELDLTKRKADSANEAKSLFLANMSHEIRTPINSILGFTELLTQGKITEEQKDYLDAIRLAGENLLALINDILDLSKLESRKIKINPIVFHLPHFLHDLKALFLPLAVKKNLKLGLEVSSSVPDYILMDLQRLRQILINLIGNSIKFTQEGKITLTVLSKPGTEKDHRTLLFIVSDTGVGIPKDRQSEIFQKFSQIGKVENTEGSGLGLFITKEMTELMNGTISLVSDSGEGSIFTVRFDRVKVSDPISVQAMPKEPNPEEITTWKEKKILIVDDNELNRMLVKRILDRYQIASIQATNGQDAIDTARRENPNLILMDMKMPIMDGMTATRILKSQKTTKHIPIIALTAHAFREEEEKIRENGCDGFLAKPIDQQKLFSEIRTVFQKLENN